MMRYPPYRDTVVTCNGFFMKADASSSDPSVLDVLEAPAEQYLRGPANRSLQGDIRLHTAMEVGAFESPPE